MTHDPFIPTPHRIVEKRQETLDTVTLVVEPETPFVFAPGQFNMLYALGRGEVPISISGDPGEPSRLVHTLRAVGLVTDALAALEVGASLVVRGPFGSSWPVEEAKGHDVLIVAGGIGLAPLRSTILHILRHREDYGRLAILYGARTDHDLCFADDLHEWGGRFDVEVRVTVDRGSPAWRGRQGVVTAVIDKTDFDPARTVAMVCGPEVMMRHTARALRAAGMKDEQVYLTLERNMKCGIGQCGHCQLGGELICRDGPVYPYPRVAPLMRIREL